MGFMALLFLGSASALVIAIVIQGAQSSDQNNTSANNTAVCDIQQPVTGVGALPIPAAYKPGSKVSRVQTTDFRVGSGPVAKKGDCLVVKYVGTLASNGTQFDTNFNTDNALQFVLGEGEVIPGWDQGLVGMKVGGERRLVIPAALAYGSTGSGSSIPPNSDLVFVVDLVKIK